MTEAAVLFETGRPLRVVRLTVPSLKPGQVLTRISFSGVCKSQLLEVDGGRGVDKYLPHTLGHEGVGTVLEVGEGVTKVKPKDRVVLTWIKGRGADVPGTTYTSADGETINSGAISTFMQQAVVSENRLVPIPDTMSLQHAALLGCAVSTGAGIVLNSAKMTRGSSLVVIGAGGIGANVILAASMVGLSPIIAVDVSDQKLLQARKAGATHVVNSSAGDARTAILRLTNDRGADFSVETAGKRETMELAVGVVREGGGLCVIAGNLPNGERFFVDPFDLIKGRKLIGTWGGDCRPDEDIPKFVRWHGEGRLDLNRLATHTYSLADINSALDALRQGNVGRALVEMPGVGDTSDEA